MFPFPWLMPWQFPCDQFTTEQEERSEQLPQSKERYKRIWNKRNTEILYRKSKKASGILQKPIDEFSEEDLVHIARELKRTPLQCITKLREIILSGTLQAGKWSAEEDNLLIQMVEQNARWGVISKRLSNEFHKGAQVRSGKRCKERWCNHLNPTIYKGPWTPQDDLKLVKLIQQHGKQWSIISQSIPERTVNSIKNRFKSMLNKEHQQLNSLDSQSILIRIIDKLTLELI